MAAHSQASLYTPLGPTRKEIRLLTIEPGAPFGPLHGKMRTVSIAEVPSPQYDTISYCWGDKMLTEEVFVNHLTVHVTTSSKAVLEALRSQYQAYTVWVDAVCINQKDTGERSSQVALMGDIYRTAHCNQVYLGPDPGNVATNTVEALQAISRRIERAEALLPQKRRHAWLTEFSLIAKSHLVIGEYEGASRLAANSTSTTLHIIVCVLVQACLLVGDSRSFDTQTIGTIRDAMYGLAKLIKHLHDFGLLPTRSERFYSAGGFYRLLSIHSGNRAFFHTDTGHVGSGHLLLQDDDVIVILQGGLIPYILRPTDDGNYRFVGPAYVFGFELGGFRGLKTEHDWITIC